MALYGNGSFTVIVLSRAPSALASEMPAADGLRGDLGAVGRDEDAAVHGGLLREMSTRRKCAPFLRAAAPGPQCRLDPAQPSATGRAGSDDHSLHEPGYNAEPGRPATSIASRLWQAVTPEPH
jgi:hypothetical protein